MKGDRGPGSGRPVSASKVRPTLQLESGAPRSAGRSSKTFSIAPEGVEHALTVAVRVRPLIGANQDERSDILREMDKKVVVVLDPDSEKSYLDSVQHRSKEKRYTFDVVFGKQSTNEEVYDLTVGRMVADVMSGRSATVFAYGATGSGKTHTMVGNEHDPGLMVLAVTSIFRNVRSMKQTDGEYTVSCSYLEVYNEVIYDLLVQKSTALDLREDPNGNVKVSGLRSLEVSDVKDIMKLLETGNARRKTESTKANATSSRSHAVLEIQVNHASRPGVHAQSTLGKLALVDLAGSERAAETGNAGQKLRDGANINKSLLALANCINALGKATGGRSLGYVPYRHSKLTRLLKDGLSGNSRTCMVATVSCAAHVRSLPLRPEQCTISGHRLGQCCGRAGAARGALGTGRGTAGDACGSDPPVILELGVFASRSS
ncbi:kinesin-like protein [Cymbomonas tetramitiformis]|uniref:Kinesin-like protein n=1 Tax=Cymbomonas tetramitiformis TaxID=36881 RepID=A0AAE0FRF0_9CHLO|nr:kinesin-like protein [Cymbomonas tetramitiformis]